MAKKSAVGLLVVLAFGLAAVVWGRRAERPPAQPIAFDHRLHRDQKMECLDCHQQADKARNAGLPTANLCMTCHQAIKFDSPEVKKIAAFRDSHQAIPWVRLYQVPNFVYFNHSRHVRLGIACGQCHHNTGTVTVSRTEREFTMNFCVDCHREQRASVDCATCHQ